MATETVRAPESCRDHPMRPAVAGCASCKRPLCDECYRFRVGARPACARCAYEATTRHKRRGSLAAAFLSLSVGGGVWATRRFDLWEESPGGLILGAIAAVAIAGFIAASGKEREPPSVENREPAEEPVEEPVAPVAAHPYRAGARRILMAASPRVSGSVTSAVVALSFAASAVLLPASVKLPRWVEVELVLGLWWIIVGVTLSVLLYRGFRLRDDFVYFAPWNRPASSDDDSSSGGSGSALSGCGDGCSGLDGCSGIDGEGLVVVAALAVVFALAFGAAWVFVEFAMPLVFFLMYGLLMRAIGRVANDRHGCGGALMKSLGWGALWATVYVLPIAVVTWAIHALR